MYDTNLTLRMKSKNIKVTQSLCRIFFCSQQYVKYVTVLRISQSNFERFQFTLFNFKNILLNSPIYSFILLKIKITLTMFSLLYLRLPLCGMLICSLLIAIRGTCIYKVCSSLYYLFIKSNEYIIYLSINSNRS